MILSGLSDPRGIAVDPSRDKMFWASDEANGAIYWAKCDGSEAEVLIGSLSVPADLLLDLERRMIYWCDRNSNQLRQRDLDGAGGGTVLFTGGILDRPHGLVLDPETNTMFWTDPETELIGSGAMDGSSNVMENARGTNPNSGVVKPGTMSVAGG